MKLFRQELIELPRCILDESNNTHQYLTPDNKKYPSVTTMLAKTKDPNDEKSLLEWRESIGPAVANYIMSTAAKIGRETHKLNENYINMLPNKSKFSLLSLAHHRNFIKYLNKTSNIYGVEAKLFSHKLRLAGTADLIAEYDGKLSLIDYKTKRSQQSKEWLSDYFIQTTAYSIMWEEITKSKIEQLVILVSSEQNTIQEFIETPKNYLNALDAKLIKFNKMR